MVDSAITNHNLSTAEELLAELNPHASVSSNEDPRAPLREEPVPSHPWVQNIPSTMNGHSLASNATRRNFGSLAASEHDDHQRPNDVVTRADMLALSRAQGENLIALIQRSRKHSLDDEFDYPDDPDDEPPPIGRRVEGNQVQILPVESLPTFKGDSEGRDAAGAWLQRLEETAVSCGWTDVETKRRFRLHVARPVQDWFAQLDPRYKVKWNTIRSRFVKEFVQSPIPNEEIYYTMKQRPGESNKAYLFRFNAAARKINLDYVGNRRNLRLHIKRYARALVDKTFGATLLPIGFQSMMELEEHLDTQRENEAMKAFQHGIKESASPPFPKTKGKVAYMESNSSMDLTEALRAEIYALGRGPLKRELCQECGEEHYKPDGKCWTNTTCSLCQRKGHPDSNCFKV
ncbi:hypothetical protein Ae201684_008646 [Aphanomyces euteiches]|uniref:Retrotransposon gag domain-containing protein n=1 Tax=Aphanomyces euteiches TaxID=100861 RepID=A0A6G0X4T4_9STRA|nr:hypothetical protein Ae201684_008646 [Aphanomyces euteiches]